MLYKVLTEILLQVTCHNMYTVQQDVVIMSQAEKILIREYLILSHLCMKAQFYWTHIICMIPLDATRWQAKLTCTRTPTQVESSKISRGGERNNNYIFDDKILFKLNLGS